MKKYQVKIAIEAYVWLDAENPEQAMFMANDIASASAGTILAPVLHDIEIGGTEAVEVFEVSESSKGCVSVENSFEPKRGILQRYSLEGIAKQRGISVEELKLESDELLKTKQKMIDGCIKKGMTQEQAETHVMRCLYIPGFAGPTFND